MTKPLSIAAVILGVLTISASAADSADKHYRNQSKYYGARSAASFAQAGRGVATCFKNKGICNYYSPIKNTRDGFTNARKSSYYKRSADRSQCLLK